MARGSSSVGAIQGGRVAVAVTLDDSQYVLGLAKVKSSLKTLSAGLNTFSNSVIRAGMALGVPMAAALRQFTEFDHQMRVVRAVTQSSEAQFAALTARARELGKTTSWTAREVAEGMTSLGRMGWKPKEIDAAISAMMDLARATDSDVATVSTLASNTMRAFKASSREATHYADVLTVAANKSSQTVVDIGEAMTIVGPLAKQAGQSFEDTAAALMVMANNGVRGSIAGTALRNAIVKLNDATRQETLAKYGVKVRDVYGNMRNLARIMGELFENTRGLGTGELTSLSAEIFGLRGMLGGSVLVNNIKETEEVIKAVGEAANGEANRVARGIEEGLWGATRIAISAFQDLGLAIGNAFSQDLQNSLQRVTTFVRGLSTWVKQNKEQVKQAAKWVLQCLKYAIELKTVLKLASVTAGVVKFAAAFGKLASQILAAKTAMEAYNAAAGVGGAAGVAAGAAGKGAKAAAGAAAGGAAASGGGALGTAANGAIIGSSMRGMAGKGAGTGVRAAWRDWRASKQEVAALQKDAAAKASASRLSQLKADLARGEANYALKSWKSAKVEAARKVAEQKVAKRAYAQTASSLGRVRDLGMARYRANEIAARLDEIRNGRGAYSPYSSFLADQREYTSLLKEQRNLQEVIRKEVQRQEALTRTIQAGRAARVTKTGVNIAGSRLAAAEGALADASKMARAKEAASAGANAALLTSLAGGKAAGVGLLKTIGLVTAKLGLLAVVAGEVAVIWWKVKQIFEGLGIISEQKARLSSVRNETASFFAKKTPDSIAEFSGEIDKFRKAMDDLVSFAKTDLTERGRAEMRNSALFLADNDDAMAQALVDMVQNAVQSGSFDSVNEWMRRRIEEKFLNSGAWWNATSWRMSAEDAYGRDSDEYRAAQEAINEFTNKFGKILASYEMGQGISPTQVFQRFAMPKTEDLSQAETSFAESAMSPYEKSMAELAKRQEQYAALIQEKTAELGRLMDTQVYSQKGWMKLWDEMNAVVDRKAEFDRNIEAERIKLTKEENLSRVDRLSGAVADAIRQQAALGPGGQQLAQKMQAGWVGYFQSMLDKLYERLRAERANAIDPLGDGGVEITQNERARVTSLSEVFARIAEKLEGLRSLDLGIEAEKTASASVVGSYKASEVFGQIVATRPIEETAKNTHKQAEIGQKQLRLLEAQNTILRDIKDNSGLVFAS